MEDGDLAQGIAEVRAGNLQRAQALLARVVQQNPQSELGWLWLGHCLPDPQKRRFCYQKVLALNPQNQTAQRALQALDAGSLPALPEASAKPVPPKSAEAEPSRVAQKNKSNATWRRWSWLPILGIALLACIIAAPILYLLMTGLNQSRAVSLPASPSSNPTRIPATATLRASSTASIVPTDSISTATLASRAFKPGDPTATPLGGDITDPNFVQGVIAYDADDFESVIKLMNAVISSNPDLAPPYRYRGMAQWYLHDCESGLPDLEKALSLDSDYAVAWADRGLMYECLGNEAQALKDYERALSLDPSLAFVHHNLGVYNFGIGDFETSLEEYGLSVAIDPTRAAAWGGMSEALSRLGRFVECIEDASKAIEIKPDLWLAYADRGDCHSGMQNYGAAKADYLIYVEHTTTDSAAWYNLGIAQRHSADPAGAVLSYSKSLELNSSYSPAYINRGVAYLDLEQYDLAVIDFNSAIKLVEDPLAYSSRGDAYYGLKKYDRAIADYKKAIALDPLGACNYRGLALTYFELRRYQDAIDAAETTHLLDATCGGPKLLEIEARSYYALGDYEQGLVYIDQALAIKSYSLGYYYRGILLQAAGRNAEAILELERFLSSSQSNGYNGKEVADAKARLAKLKP